MSQIAYKPGGALRLVAGTFGGVFWRQNFIPKAGEWQYSHKHPIDHVTFLVRGRIEAKIENEPDAIYEAPAFVPVKAEKCHSYKALDDGTMYYCIFNSNIFPEEKTMELHELQDMITFLCGNCGGCNFPK